MAILRRLGADEALLAAMLLLTRTVNEQDRLSEARAIWEDAVSLAERTEHPRYAAMSLVQLANSLYREGAFEAAEEFWRRALDHYESLGDLRYQAEVKLSLGYVAYRLGRPDDSLELAAESLQLSERAGRSDLRASTDELVSRLAAAN